MNSDDLSSAASSSGAQPESPPSEIVERLRSRPHGEARYASKGEIARGGMGAIVRVFDCDLRRHLAMKVMLDGPGNAGDSTKSEQGASLRRHARFLEEAQITGQLDHPGIVPVHELGLDSRGRLFFTMKLVKGRDLREVFALVHEGREGWNLPRALGVLLRVCEAMAFAHEKGVIHRDLKPANIMVGRFGEVYVMDWGLAKVLGRPDTHDVRIKEPGASHSLVHTERKDLSASAHSPLATMDGDVVGTPCYMPPEQARGRLEDIGPHSDVYSLGAMLYQLLSAHMPYAGKDESTSPFTVLGLLIQGPPPELAKLTKNVPQELIAICEKAMARDVRERYPSMLGVAEDLRAFLEGRVVKAHETGAVAEFRSWLRRNRGFAGAVAAALAVVLGLSALMVRQQLRANEDLQLAKDDAEKQREFAVQRRAEAEESQRRAEGAFALMSQVNTQLSAAKRDAESKEELARRRSYTANIAAAAASLRFEDLSAVRSRLDECPDELRHWEWRYLDARSEASAASVTTFERGKADRIALGDAHVRIAVDADEHTLIAACGPASNAPSALARLKFVDLESGQPRGELELDHAEIIALAASGDRRRVAAIGSSKRIHVVDVDARKVHATWVESDMPTVCAALDARGTRLALLTADRRLRVLDCATGALLREFPASATFLLCATFSHDDRSIALGASDGRVYVFELLGPPTPRVLGDPGARIEHVAFSADDQRLLVAAGDPSVLSQAPEPWASTVREWEVGSGRLLSLWSDQASGVDWCAYGRGENSVIATGAQGSIRVRNVSRNDSTTLPTDDRRIVSAATLRGGRALVGVDQMGEVRVWDTSVGAHSALFGHRMAIDQVEFLADHRRLVSRGADGVARVWDTRAGEPIAILTRLNLTLGTVSNLSRSMCTSPVDARVAFGFSGGRVRTYDVERFELLLEGRSGTDADVDCLRFDARGTRLAAGKSDGYVSILDAATNAPLSELRGTEGPVSAVEWFDDGRKLAVGTRDGALSIWELESGERVALHEGLGPIHGLEAARGALDIDCGSVRRTLTLPDYALGPAATFQESEGQRFRMGDSPRVVARVGTKGLAVFEERGGAPLIDFRAAFALRTLSVSRDGHHIAAGFDDGSIRVWTDARTAELAQARRQAQRARELALPHVAELFETRALDREHVEAELLRDETISEALREAALRMCRATRGEPISLRGDCLETVRSGRAEVADYKLALWRALAMQRIDEQDDRAVLFEGAARFRLGELDAAEAALARARALRRSSRTPPEHHAFAALIACQRGRLDEARAELAQLSELMKRQMESTKQSNNELASEIAARIALSAARQSQ
ncbi:MAG: protein kinase [Planctomycetes bacterium]|nr:protein kinase [Planctomycetota bacterium]